MKMFADFFQENTYYAIEFSDNRWHITVDQNDGRKSFSLNFTFLEDLLSHIRESYPAFYKSVIEGIKG